MRKFDTFLKTVLFACFSLISFRSSAQLSGSYTIGGVNPSYTTIGSAINALNTNGVSGNVEFNIRPGNYSGFSLDSIPALAFPDSVIFQSETHDSNDVVISGNSTTIQLSRCYGVTLKWLTIKATSVTSAIAIDFIGTYGCNLKNCIINTPNSVSTTSSNSAVFIERNDFKTQFYNTVENCRFTGSGGGITLEYADCVTRILNNKIESTGRYSLYSTYSTISTIDNNMLNGEIAFRFTTGEAFTNNKVHGEVDLRHFNLIEGNICTGSVYNAFRSISHIYRNNYFGSGLQVSSVNSPVIDNNVFVLSVSISQCRGTKFYNNTALSDVNFSFSDSSTLVGNSINGYLSFGGRNFKIYCNLFYNYVQVGRQNAKFYYNNFSENAYIWSQEYDIEARYNNFSQPAYASGTITHNNYFPTGGEYDAHPFRYDPMYISASNVRAQNPLLIGKGLPVSYITQDIDSVIRGSSPTIGANEICISAFSDIDSINIYCGDRLKLKLCSIDTTGNYSWHPTTGLDDSTSITPFARPVQSTTYYLLDSLGVVKDSIYMAVDDFIWQYLSDDSIACYQKVLLISKFNPTAIYNWTPSSGLSDSTAYNPWAYPPITTTYLQQVDIAGCGVFYDTVTVFVDPLPVADGQVHHVGLNALFYNYSLCGDSFFWNFGDGQTSNLQGDTGIFHHYDTAGIYIVSLVACNSFGCDTFYFTINAVNVGINEANGFDGEIQIFPNPATNVIFVKGIKPHTPIVICNVLGQTLANYFPESEPITIDISNLSNGMYFINNRRFVKE